MDKASKLIVSVEPLDNYKVRILTSDGFFVTADLSRFRSVHCFPKDKADWMSVCIDSSGLDLIWRTRFEVHVDQVLDNSIAQIRAEKMA
jgi:hypothetical protein